MTIVEHGVSWVTSAVALVPLGPESEVADLARSRDSGVFTGRERRLSAAGRGLEGWAGRLAAKRAVADVLDRGAGGCAVPLGAIEIVPRATALCADVDRCPAGHPPSVRLLGPAGPHLGAHRRVDVSITHTRTVAVAVALLVGEAGSEAAVGA